MTIRRGMFSDQVRKVQQKLADLGFLKGPVDSDFGGGTESAVKNFQKSKNVRASGLVDEQTWELLFPGEPKPVSPMASQPLIRRCLALTGSFETGKQPPECFCGLSGDFDGQGISFGVLQWNIGQGSLQDLLKDAFQEHPGVCEEIFHEHLDTLRELGTAPRNEQLEFTRSIQRRGVVNEPWSGMLKTLGRTPEFQDVQVRHAQNKFDKALEMCADYGISSERAVALLFDIITQNGSISKIVRAQIFADFKSLPESSADDTEVAKMRIIANRRAAAANPKWVDDVRKRKLTIAEGTGTVHGIFYDLEDMFGITLRKAQSAAA